VDEYAAPGDAVAAMEWREEIQRALGRLGPAHREAFLLRHVEGLEYEEMARLTGANETALRMRVKRAAERLRELLRDVHVR
jgi:RNA polymerase sigma-70 factor (ECF subfamily)